MLKLLFLLSIIVFCDGFFLLAKLLKLMALNPNYNSGFQFREYSSAQEEYDFIIVGASPSGCVLANRLSENVNWKILLLEAGKIENIFNEVPAFTTYKQSTDYNWGYTAEPQNGSCWGMIDGRCALPKGKGLGGSSLINYMTYIRGTKQDFDEWANSENPGWSYDDVLPYFIKSEGNNIKSYENSSFHGKYGPLSVEFPPYRTQIAKAFGRSAKENGYKKVDYNGESQLGVSYIQAMTQNGQRHSAYRAYIDPILNTRRNLVVKTYSRATKVLIDPSTKAAYGVEYSYNKRTFTVKAKKEVILSAGVFNSPQLLMLSGIGPKEHLEELFIPVVKNLPVGESLLDHVKFPGPTFLLNSTGQSIKFDTHANFDVWADFTRGMGPLTLPGTIEAVAFKNTENSSDKPDIGIVFSTASLASDRYGLKTSMRLKDDIYNFVYRPLEYVANDQWTSYTVLLNPRSQGYIRLKSNNPFHSPKIYTNALTEQEDVRKLIEGIKEAIVLSQSKAFAKYGLRLHRIPLPNCEKHDFGTDIYWECAVRTLTSSFHQQTGTCKMGAENDPKAVVSSNLTVHGVANLRVIDESVIPLATSGDTVTIAFMIGEKGADLIKKNYQ